MLPFLLIGVFVLFGILSLYSKATALKHIPHPPASILWGNAGSFSNPKTYHLVVWNWVQKYGPVCSFSILQSPRLIVAAPKLVREILIAGQNNYRANHVWARGDYANYREAFGISLQNSEGEEWKWRRQILMPLFHQSKVMQLLPAYISNCTNKLIEHLRENEGKIVDMQLLFLKLTLRVITFYLFGKELNYGSITEFRDYFVTLLDRNAELMLVPKWVPTNTKRKAQQARQKIASILQPAITDSLEELKKSGNDQFKGVIFELLQRPEYTSEKLLLEYEGLLFAGHDTTTNTLSFVMSVLATNRQVENLVLEEVNRVIKNDSPSQQDVAKLTYLTSTVQETLRFYPTAWEVVHQTLQDTTVGGYHAPKNTETWVFLYGAYRDEEMFPEPDKFKPERFIVDDKQLETNDDATGAPSFAFSLGAHSCLGKSIALLELRIVISLLIKEFSFEVAPNQPLGDGEIEFTLKPNNCTMYMIPKRR